MSIFLKSQQASDILGEGGVFSDSIENFVIRDSQVEMAGAIEHTISEGQTLLAESGTGTGKTFAYLVPALLSGKKTLISTGTCLLYTSPSPRDLSTSRMPSSA